QQDPNVQIPLDRLAEFRANRVIGQLSSVFWSFCGFIPDAARLADEMLPKVVERLKRQEVQAALLIPASLLCHQSVALAARAIESAGIPTITLGVVREVRSEEHTSELQSRFDLVCRLLLEKKKHWKLFSSLVSSTKSYTSQIS